MGRDRGIIVRDTTNAAERIIAEAEQIAAAFDVECYVTLEVKAVVRTLGGDGSQAVAAYRDDHALISGEWAFPHAAAQHAGLVPS